jgi:hypothetical protein
LKRCFFLIPLFFILLSGCKAYDKMTRAVSKTKSSIKNFVARIFRAESESTNFAVRIHQEFFVYFPPMADNKDREQDVALTALSVKIQDTLTELRVEAILNEDLEKQLKSEKKADIKYLDIRKYRVFIEPRFISFDPSGKKRSVLAHLDKGKYALSMQSQIVIRDRLNGRELVREDVSVKKAGGPRVLMDFGDKKNLAEDLSVLTKTTAVKIIDILKDRPSEQASNEKKEIDRYTLNRMQSMSPSSTM